MLLKLKTIFKNSLKAITLQKSLKLGNKKYIIALSDTN